MADKKRKVLIEKATFIKGKLVEPSKDKNKPNIMTLDPDVANDVVGSKKGRFADVEKSNGRKVGQPLDA